MTSPSIYIRDLVSKELGEDLTDASVHDIQDLHCVHDDQFEWPGRSFTRFRGVTDSRLLRPGASPSSQPLRV